MTKSINVGDIPIPIPENPILSSRDGPGKSPRLLKRGEVLGDNSIASDSFSFNSQEKWPSLSISKNGSPVVVNVEVNEAVEAVNAGLVSSSEGVKKDRVVSFASAV